MPTVCAFLGVLAIAVVASIIYQRSCMSDSTTPNDTSGQEPQILKSQGVVPTAFKRGAKKTPPHKLLAVPPFVPTLKAPTPTAYVPQKFQMWGNDQYGDCVTAEEAYAKDCCGILLSDQVVVQYAKQHGWDNGATLTEVLDAFVNGDGFSYNGAKTGDGPYKGVDYSNESILQAAVAVGPVKIAIDANALPGDAGNKQGWFAVGGSPGQFGNTDHCVAIGGFGTAQFLFQALGLSVPSAIQPSQTGYLIFTWSTLGFVDHAWIMSTVVEAYVRNPTSVPSGPIHIPSDGPTPPPPPPPPGPGPGPAPDHVPLAIQLQGMFPSGLFGHLINVTMTGVATPVSGPHAQRLDMNWLAVIQDAMKLVTDFQKGAGWQVLLADIFQLAKDLGLPIQGHQLKTPDWQAVLRDISKLAADFQSGAGFSVILADLIQLARDFGLPV